MFNFKKEEVTTESKTVYTGNVRFIYKEEILEGRIFGEPYRNPGLLFSAYQYNILVGTKLYKGIPHHEIEKYK